jgi:hypothetical protein
MGKNPFHEDLDDMFRGVRVRTHTDEHTYEGWCGRWHYNEHAAIIYDAERDDGEEVGAVTLSNPETVERPRRPTPLRRSASQTSLRHCTPSVFSPPLFG